jgi:hypothetical protein
LRNTIEDFPSKLVVVAEAAGTPIDGPNDFVEALDELRRDIFFPRQYVSVEAQWSAYLESEYNAAYQGTHPDQDPTSRPTCLRRTDSPICTSKVSTSIVHKNLLLPGRHRQISQRQRSPPLALQAQRQALAFACRGNAPVNKRALVTEVTRLTLL